MFCQCSDIAPFVLSQLSVSAESVLCQLKTLKALMPDSEGAREGEGAREEGGLLFQRSVRSQ